MARLSTTPPGGPMNQLLIEPAPANVRRVGPIARKLGVVLAAAGMLALGLLLARGPDFVDHVRVTNDSGYDLNVDVTGAERDGWLPISVATGGSTTTTKDVVDQRDTWIFRFSYAGNRAGEVSVSRTDLERRGWSVVVPPAVATRLRAEGILPGP
jgi:hypothetical protein